MRPRHRIPVIFSLSMLDVLCCGLGAVILLMVLYSWDARRQAGALVAARTRVGETAERLAERETTLKETEAVLEAERKEKDQKMLQLAAVTREAEDAKKRLNAAQTDLTKLQRDLDTAEAQHLEAAALAAQLPDLREELLHARQVSQDLGGLLAEERRVAAALQTKLSATEQLRADADTNARLVPGLRRELAAAMQRTKDLETVLGEKKSDADKIAGGLATIKEQLAATEQRAKEQELELGLLRKRAAESGNRLADAQTALDQEKSISATLRRQLSQPDGRFAGVDLTGKRVVLLVDTSGSMASVDTNTADPNKWPEVCRTVAQVLTSLPQVEKYQVILFSDTPRYLLDQPGKWLEYERGKSPDDVRAAMLKVKPSGNTHMYSAFETAFQFKSQGLDAIYLFSDGLPNVGPGLPQPVPTDENVQATHLGKYLRDTIRTRWGAGEPRVKIHGIGFFYESPNLGAFLWALSRENGGSFVGMSKP